MYIENRVIHLTFVRSHTCAGNFSEKRNMSVENLNFQFTKMNSSYFTSFSLIFLEI